MNDIFKAKADIWNKRLKKLVKEHGTQEEFAEALNSTYETHFTQKSVSKWLNVGSTKTKGGKVKIINFPKYETMALIAAFFDVDIGYLTGETNYKKFDSKSTLDYLGLEDEAIINNIRDLTHPETKYPGYYGDSRQALNCFLGAPQFKEMFSRVIDLYGSSPLSGIPDYQKFDHFEGAMGYAQDVNESISYQKFLVCESFFNLLEKQFPYSKTDDFLIDDIN